MRARQVSATKWTDKWTSYHAILSSLLEQEISPSLILPKPFYLGLRSHFFLPPVNCSLYLITPVPSFSWLLPLECKHVQVSPVFWKKSNLTSYHTSAIPLLHPREISLNALLGEATNKEGGCGTSQTAGEVQVTINQVRQWTGHCRPEIGANAKEYGQGHNKGKTKLVNFKTG